MIRRVPTCLNLLPRPLGLKGKDVMEGKLAALIVRIQISACDCCYVGSETSAGESICDDAIVCYILHMQLCVAGLKDRLMRIDKISNQCLTLKYWREASSPNDRQS